MEEERGRQDSTKKSDEKQAEPMAVDNEEALLAQALAMSMDQQPQQQKVMTNLHK